MALEFYLKSLNKLSRSCFLSFNNNSYYLYNQEIMR